MRKLWPRKILLSASLVAGSPAIAVAQSSQDKDHSTHTITLDQLNPCNGETVVISGTIEVFSHSTTDPHGIKHFSRSVVPHLEGQGSTGKYTLVGVTREHDTYSATETELPQTQSFTSRYHVVSQGSAPNYLDDYATRLTIQADGSIEFQFEHIASRCVGG